MEASTDDVFPTSTLDPDVRDDLEHVLRIKRKRIMFHYACFVSRLCDCVKERGVTVEHLRTFLLKLPSFSPDKDDGEESSKLLYGVKSKLEEADTVHKIFDLIGEECASFLNYDVYQFILDKYCSDMKCDEFKYPEKLEAYINEHRIDEFFGINPQLENFDQASKKVKLKFDIASTSKVVKIINLKSALADVLGLIPSALRLFSIEEGCVVVTFLIPSSIADVISKILTPELLQALSILWVKCDEYKMSSSRHSDSGAEQCLEDTPVFTDQCILVGKSFTTELLDTDTGVC